MKKLILLSLSFFVFSSGAIANGPFDGEIKFGFDLPSVLKLIRDNMNGWTKLGLEDGRVLWTPSSFYSKKISDPKVWISQIKELGFCQPDKAWKDFPVLSVSNDAVSEGFERAAMNPDTPFATQMFYSEMVIVGGKARNVSYDYRQKGPNVNMTCRAANELGDVQTIEQSFDIRNPKKFEVQQKKNGKLLAI